jgi:hypothetical protein
MSKNITNDKIEYTISLVSDFSKKYSISTTQAFNYFDKFKALDFINTHYNIAHTLPFSDMVENLALYCRKNGGTI